MSKINFSTNLFLEKLELTRFREFLDEDGFRKLFKLIAVPGLYKGEELLWSNGLIEQDLDNSLGKKVLRINPVIGVDSNGEIFTSELRLIEVPAINIWYWVKVSHSYSNIELGTFSIDTSGNLIGINSELLKIFRQLPNFPTKIKFVNSVYNTQEYEILEVISDTNAVLNGDSFVAEVDLKLAIVGTFTPGVIIPEIEKYPFDFDSCSIQLIEESTFNTKPTHQVGVDFFLGRVKVIDNQLIIQDKRNEVLSTTNTPLFVENPLIGIESVRYTDTNGNNERNLVEIAWGMRSSNWSVQSSRNIVTLYGSSLGGKYKTVDSFTDGDFNGWRFYTDKGTYNKVITSNRIGNAINLVLDKLDIDDFSNDGGLTFREQQVLVVPDAESIEIEFSTTLENVRSTALFPINTDIGRIELVVYDFPACSYFCKYRYIDNKISSKWTSIPSDDKRGYYTEVSFNLQTGLIKESGLVRKKYTTSDEVPFIELTAYQNNIFYIKNRLDINLQEVSTLIFNADSPVFTLVPKVNQAYQLVNNDTFANNTSTESFYLNFSTDVDLLKTGNRFEILISRDLAMGNKVLSITTGYLTDLNPGTILKEFTSRDVQLAKSNGGYISVEMLFDGVNWNFVQNYELGAAGEVRIFQGFVSSYFDNSGIGKAGGWLGFAICNGSNGTSDLSSNFILESSSLTTYKLLYAKRIL